MFKPNIALLLLILSCQDRSPTTVIKDAVSDDRKVVQLNSLFRAIIGRQTVPSETEIDGINPIDLAGLRDKSYTYEEQVEAILKSQQFIDGGFFYFHQQRLSLLKRFDVGIIEIFSPYDFEREEIKYP